MFEITRMKLLSFLLLGGALALGIGLAIGHVLHCGLGLACPLPSVPGSGEGETKAGSTARPVSVVGDAVRPVTPGTSAPLNLTLSNPNRVRLVATHLRVTVGVLEAPRATAERRCTAADFHIIQAPRNLRLSLPALSTTSLRSARVDPRNWPSVTMIDRTVNQNGCKSASLRLHFSLTATGARR